MILSRNRENLSEDIYDLFGTTNDEEILEVFKKNLTEKIEYINTLLNVDFDELTNEEFYYLIRGLYSITLTEKDFLNYISKERNKVYTHFRTLPTTMYFKENKSEGKGINYSYWNQPYQVFVEAAIAENTTIDPKKNYSKIDINNMHNSRNITVLDYDSIEIEEYIKSMEEISSYPVKPLKLAKSIVPNNEEYKDEFDYYISAIRRKVTKVFILKELHKYMDELNEELYNIFIHSSLSYGYGIVSQKCKDWYKETNISEEINDISKRLSKK